MNRWIWIIGLGLISSAAWASWGPMDDTVHFGTAYYDKNPGQLTQRYEFVTGSVRRIAPFYIGAENWYGNKTEYERPDAEVQSDHAWIRRYKAVFGEGFRPKDWDSVLRSDFALELLWLGERHAPGFDPAEMGKVIETYVSDDSKGLAELRTQTTSQLTKDAIDVAEVGWKSGEQDTADRLLAFAKKGNGLKPYCLLIASQILLKKDEMPEGGVREMKPNVEKARLVLWQLLSEFPDDPNVPQALGWMGYVHRWYGHEGIAAEWYLKQAIHAQRERMSLQAWASIHISVGNFKPYEAKWLHGQMVADPRLIYPYVEYRMARSHSLASMKSLWVLADKLASDDPGAKFPARACGLFANLAYLEGAYSKATVWARRAESSNDQTAKAMGLSIRGAVAKKRGRFSESASLYEACLRLPSYESLKAGAMENLAMVYEKQGRLGKALDLYFGLGYMPDVAYMMDIRMTPSQLESYFLSHPNHPYHGLVRYSLAIRYLRNEDFAKTHEYLDRIPEDQLYRYASLDSKFASEDDGVLIDPRKVLQILESGRAKVKAAKGSEAKAAALFELASTVYKHRSLMLYNPAVWRFEKVWRMMLYVYDDDDAYRFDFTPNAHQELPFEPKVFLNMMYWLRKGMPNSETVYHSYLIAKEVVDKYPKSKVAAQAAYRAATSLERLGNLHEWYRAQGDGPAYLREASRLMAWIPKHHPESPLVKEAKKFTRVYSKNAKELTDYRSGKGSEEGL